jgi:hypothetical protein
VFKLKHNNPQFLYFKENTNIPNSSTEKIKHKNPQILYWKENTNIPNSPTGKLKHKNPQILYWKENTNIPNSPTGKIKHKNPQSEKQYAFLWATVFTEIIANAFRSKVGINHNTGLPLLCGKRCGILLAGLCVDHGCKRKKIPYKNPQFFPINSQTSKFKFWKFDQMFILQPWLAQ